jgi:hypothetical protein
MGFSEVNQTIKRAVAGLVYPVLAALGLLTIAGTVILASTLPGRELAIAVAVVGSCLGTGLLALALPKILSRSHQANQRVELSRSDMKTRLQAAEEAQAAAQRQALNAAREIARLESMRVNVAAFQPILKLGLLEVETTLTDFQRRVLGEQIDPAWWRNGSRTVYHGVVQMPVKAHLGIDLQRVQVREMGANQLILSSLSMITITDTAEGATWLLDEIRTEYVKEGQTGPFKGDAHDARAKQFSREQELQLRARLKAGHDFKVFEPGLVRTAEQVLRVLLAPLGKEIIFQPEPLENSTELLAYLQSHNQLVHARVAALTEGDQTQE